MTAGRVLYRLASSCLGLVSGSVLSRRIKAGKEDPTRLNERHALDLPTRPGGTMVWLHGASVGESLMLLEVGQRLLTAYPSLQLLFTSQTQTSARLIATRLPENARHQMAPLDTPSTAQRFIAHWQPDLAIMAEGEIWPNLLGEAKDTGTRLALINARMTEKSLKGWARWHGTAHALFNSFDLILAADEKTAAGLSELTDNKVHSPGNLKSAMPPPDTDVSALTNLRTSFLQERSCFLAASTHESEETLFLDAVQSLTPRPALVIVPRHPERGDEIEALIKVRGLVVARRSRGDQATKATDVLLADTLGEMGLWYRLADVVYLGGGHAGGVGGHNPLEPVQLDKPVISGPHMHNFSDIARQLSDAKALVFAHDANELAALTQPYISGVTTSEPDRGALAAFFASADSPMDETLAALEKLLPHGEAP